MTASAPPRVVLDTNCLVSALVLRSGRLVWLRKAWQERRFTPILDHTTRAELLRVLHYPKFRLSHRERDRLLADLLPYAIAFARATGTADLPEIADPHDVKFLALAREAEADALVTGDRDLLEIRGAVRFTTILRPGEFHDWLSRTSP